MGSENLKKINPKLLEPLMESLVLVKDEKRMDYIDSIFDEIEQTTEKAQHYAKLNKVDFKTALKEVIQTRDLSSFAKDDC
jgi:predicted nucleotidyltransferase